MFVQLKSGYNTDAGPSWIERVRFSKSWRTARFHGRTLHRVTGTAFANQGASNFYDVDSGERFWISGPKRDRSDARYSSQRPMVAESVRAEYETFLDGGQLPGRENG